MEAKQCSQGIGERFEVPENAHRASNNDASHHQHVSMLLRSNPDSQIFPEIFSVPGFYGPVRGPIPVGFHEVVPAEKNHAAVWKHVHRFFG